MSEYIKTFDHGFNQIDLKHLPKTAKEIAPIELHIKQDGSIENKPSFCMVMQYYPSGVTVYAQFSLKTLTDCLDELGYDLIKRP